MARVLVVDDSEDLQEVLREELSDAGHEVASALDGAQGLRMLRERRPDVVLLDMMMPEMDGLEFLARLSGEPSPPPVVAQSGFRDFQAEALRRGAHAFLVKPLSMTILLDALRSAMEQRPVAAHVLARNAADVERARLRGGDETTSAVSSLYAGELEGSRAHLRRVTGWLHTYFGFGTSMVSLLRGADLYDEAVHGPLATQFPEGGHSPREMSYCDDVIAAGSTLVLSDPGRHPLPHFARHKLLDYGVQFYAGVPLRSPGGTVLGTMCIVDTSPREFRTEDMRVLEAFGRGAGRGLQTRVWPLDSERVLRRDYLELFIDVAATRAARDGCAALASLLAASDARVMGLATTGLACIELDGRVALVWSGPANGWAPPESLARTVLASVELRGARDPAAARERLRTVFA